MNRYDELKAEKAKRQVEYVAHALSDSPRVRRSTIKLIQPKWVTL